MNRLGIAVTDMQSGRQAPDGIWRRVMRGSHLRKHAAEVDLDLRKVFVHVDRKTLRHIATKMGCPLVPLELSLLS
jgi:hypothetical protein